MALDTKDAPLKMLESLRTKYVTDALLSWKRESTQNTKTNANIITLDKYRSIAQKYNKQGSVPNSENGEHGYDRLAVVLDRSIDTIMVYPPVKGDIERFKKYVANILHNNDNTKPNYVIIFPPHFYGDDVQTNAELLAILLDIKLDPATNAAIYLLVENTGANRLAGYNIQTSEIQGVTLKDPYIAGTPITHMLEPSYIIYPNATRVENEVKGGLLFSGAAANEKDILKSNTSTAASVSDFIASDKTGTIAFPPSSTNDDVLNKETPYQVYRFIGDKAHSIENDHILTFRLSGGKNIDKEEAAEPVLTFELRGGSMGKDQPEDKFYAAKLSDLATGEKLTTNQLGASFILRRPSKEVKRDWLDLKFTASEAEMLNFLNFRPSILKDIFGEVWNSELVSFLENLIVSDCFTDINSLTNYECSTSSDFYNAVKNFLFLHGSKLVEDDEEERERRQKAYWKKTVDAREQSDQAFIDSKKRYEDKLVNLLELSGETTRRPSQLTIPTDIDPAALDKNPFEDKYDLDDTYTKLVKISDDDINYDGKIFDKIIQDSSERVYFRKILTINKRNTDDRGTAEMIIKGVESFEEAADKSKEIFDALEGDYPGWMFDMSD